jgi:signal transduction histidine kinase
LYSIPEQAFLIFPIFWEEWRIVWCYTIWPKTLWDYYTEFEIEELIWLTDWISRHIEYIETYNQLEDISRNLDRKVDEKTIEYNTLISRQKEFIATLSHEIKAPLTSALLQIDNLAVDIQDRRLSGASIREEVISIWDNLAHTQTLLGQLFTTEYLEKNQATLYPERVNIIELILTQYHIQKKIHQHCIYTESIPHDPVYMSIDRTQFIQLLTNLFANALKFADPKAPEIYLDILYTENWLTIDIEDNGSWLNGIELEDIFEKYTIGNNSIWLGIGLYLCKRIVELHHGTIQGKKWKKLSWIGMEIYIPFD